MSLFSSFDRTKHFEELADPLFSDEGVLTPAQRRARCLENLGISTGTLATTGGTGIIGIAEAYSSSVQTFGDQHYIRIYIDITGLNSSATGGDVIGDDGTGTAYIAKLTAAETGTVIDAILMTCLEAPTTGDPDIDLYSADEGTGVEDTAISDLTETALIASAASWTNGRQLAATALPDPAVGEYLYLTVGNTGVAGTYASGKFLIEIYGHDT